MPMARETFFTIKEAARKLNLHEQTLRNWDRAGILKLQRLGKNRSRLFRLEDIRRCRTILKYSGRGVSLKGVKVILSLNRNGN